jgi:hypothetical protein
MYVWHFLLIFLVSFKYINEPSNNDCKQKAYSTISKHAFLSIIIDFVSWQLKSMQLISVTLFWTSTPTHCMLQDEWVCLEPILNSSLIKYLEACSIKTLDEGFLSKCYFLIPRAFVCNWNSDRRTKRGGRLSRAVRVRFTRFDNLELSYVTCFGFCIIISLFLRLYTLVVLLRIGCISECSILIC